jgi:hypothetical protein
MLELDVYLLLCMMSCRHENIGTRLPTAGGGLQVILTLLLIGTSYGVIIFGTSGRVHCGVKAPFL